MALEGDTALIGKSADGPDEVGAVYAYQPNGSGAWEQIAKLVASDGDLNGCFGDSVSLDSGVAVVLVADDSFGPAGGPLRDRSTFSAGLAVDA